jgi:hypothetical protein
LYVSDLPPPELLDPVRRKIVQAVTSEAHRRAAGALGLQALLLPAYDLSRSEKLKLALVAGLARGLFRARETLLGLASARPTGYPDTLQVLTVGGGEGDDAAFTSLKNLGGDEAPEVVEALVELAVSVGAEGWEGTPLGALFVYGDSQRVMERSRQLTLNPFQGYPEAERNLLSPEIRDAVRGFATLDGAFVVREDGVVLAAGRYLNISASRAAEGSEVIKLPLGLGARHMAAALTSLSTRALAVAVSQTTGTVRLFRRGRVILEIRPQRRRQKG